MEAAVARLVRAIEDRETIAIFGDYDVDGACSAALLAGFLDAAGCSRLIHIPDRIFEGYGPNVAAIETLKEQGAGLLVCVDCGTMSHGPLAQARALGLDRSSSTTTRRRKSCPRRLSSTRTGSTISPASASSAPRAW